MPQFDFDEPVTAGRAGGGIVALRSSLSAAAPPFADDADVAAATALLVLGEEAEYTDTI